MNKSPPMSEGDFLDSLIQLAHLYHWVVAHFRPARTEKGWRTAVSADGAGFPDLVLVRPPRLLFIECKSDKGTLSLEQKEWLSLLKQCQRGLLLIDLSEKQPRQTIPEVYCFYPSQWDEIVEILK